MSFRRPSQRREIVLGYSIILLVALSIFAGATYAILRRSLDTTGQVLKRMVGASDEDWGQLRQQYENTWKELNEHVFPEARTCVSRRG